jgi:two-component system nitrogen regulation sensor histidine kinase GlnL
MRRMERYMGLGSLAAGLHHEIKNPLAALSLHVQLLEEELTAFGVSDNVSETVAVIQAEMARVGAVLEGFRDYASLGSLSKTPVDLEQMIQQQFRLLEPRAKLQGVTLEFTGFRGLRPVLNADPVRIEQVLVNLLVNSLDAMPKGGLLKVTFQCYQDLSPPSVKIIVQDTGPGIPETLRHRIFDPYFTTKREGTGMGLALCDKIISQHNGAIEYQRQNDETTFEITLPTEFF